MQPSPRALATLLSRLPIGLIVRSGAGTIWVNDFLCARHPHLRAHDVDDVAALRQWVASGVAPAGILELDGEQYQLEPALFDDGDAMLLWPAAAAVKFAPHMKHIEQMYQDFREIYRNSFDGIFIADGAGNTLMVNEGCERNYGVPASKMVGRHVSEFQRSGLINPVIALKVIESGQRVSAVQETRIGKTIMVTGIPLLDGQGKVRKVIINSRDTTELIQLQEQLARAQERLYRLEAEASQLKMGGAAIAGLITRNPGMQQITALAQKVAKVNTTVLITGESGVGKEVIARLIHRESAYHKGSFVKINCGAIPRELLESELFGYEAGAFTGAQRQGKPGIFEVADHGTLFLDEIGELPLDLQVKLLQVLQDRTLLRLGGTRTIRIDARVVAATNRDLQAMVDARQFRGDLFYRLNVVPLHVPPLRERREDILPLLRHFLDELNAQYHFDKRLSEQALAALLDYDWPGNVRELRNMVERLVVTAPDALIRSEGLPTLLRRAEMDDDVARLDIKARTARFEHKIVREAVERYGSTRAAAKQLNISQSTVVRRLKASHAG